MILTRRALMFTGGALVAAGAAGCSVTGASDPAAGPTSAGTGGVPTGTVNILLMKQAGWTEEDWATVISKFTTANPEITVNPTFVAYEALHDKIVTSAAAGTYDVIHMDVIWPPEFAEKKMIADVTDRVPSSWKTDMQGGALQAALYKEQFYGAPAFPSTKLFYYNKDLMAKAGVTEDDITTWEGVMKAARTMMEKGVSKNPIAWSWSQAEAVVCDFAQLLGSFGGAFTDASGKLIFNDTPGQQTLQLMVDSLKDGTSAPGSPTFLEDDVIKAMQSGDTAFGLNWESAFRDLNDEKASKVVGKCGVSATPTGADNMRPGVNGAMAFAITVGSKNPDAAWKLIEFATSQGVQDPLAESAMPNWISSYSNPDVVKINPEVFKACKVAYAESILRPQVVNYNKVSSILQVEIQNALLGIKPVKTALDDAVTQGNQSLAG
ncbi:extracellular solute-binding protein [Tessaracoccus antarcticus]|uniref:Extracellular solute-binding protein n=1 Tax=Tessaracoccus antarcticus TaxID=2479848 RepID=A0A3M0GSD2_9ACTN|nr:extracellular solute-binding protein [Tessaracoccus antarcticus]RMB60216.1 extracellular solute-binding protein [Tessaracoccus antarcticus]